MEKKKKKISRRVHAPVPPRNLHLRRDAHLGKRSVFIQIRAWTTWKDGHDGRRNKSLVPSGGQLFCSCQATWSPWHPLQTSNSILWNIPQLTLPRTQALFEIFCGSHRARGLSLPLCLCVFEAFPWSLPSDYHGRSQERYQVSGDPSFYSCICTQLKTFCVLSKMKPLHDALLKTIAWLINTRCIFSTW